MIWYGKTNSERLWSAKIGRVPFIVRRFVQTRDTSPVAGIAYRSHSIGCSPLMWRTALLIVAVRNASFWITSRW